MSQTYFAPAKINLFLAITGRRADGFHDLVSVVAPLALGDSVTVEPADDGKFQLTCSDPSLPCDDSNLVMKAARAFVARTGWRGGAVLRLEKRVPAGAGMGGGSSDAVATLRGLNELAGNPADTSTLSQIAASVGSDCPLFLHDGPVVMRGRGERIEPVPASAAQRIRGRRVLVFKPEFAIATAWAYRRLAEMAQLESRGAAFGGDGPAANRSGRKAPPAVPSSPVYVAPSEAETRLSGWLAAGSSAPAEALLFNNLELPAFEKFVALPTLLSRLQHEFNLQPQMSGSGSACFALLPRDCDAAPIVDRIREAWGVSAFVADTRIS